MNFITRNDVNRPMRPIDVTNKKAIAQKFSDAMFVITEKYGRTADVSDDKAKTAPNPPMITVNVKWMAFLASHHLLGTRDIA